MTSEAVAPGHLLLIRQAMPKRGRPPSLPGVAGKVGQPKYSSKKNVRKFLSQFAGVRVELENLKRAASSARKIFPDFCEPGGAAREQKTILYSGFGTGTKSVILPIEKAVEKLFHGTVKLNRMDQSIYRVLVVDDEPSVCHSVRMMLIYSGYEVSTAWSSKEALAVLEKEPHDLVVTDFNMPGMKGDELSEIIKTRWPETPVVMLTASAANLRGASVSLPFVDVLLSKPFEIPELRGTVQRLLATGETRANFQNVSPDLTSAPALAVQ